ncbi:hypothetical protein E1A91_D05G024500v1 [Gossypium mustelinum]|uniref:Uncharacterized protein n=1 Tax=Gossypium mustelinum TaxID=34275 RepID=A0A5D2UPR4_GOSMU|nr:hypothetical protein E1A91_D05G024500v1 [Gossypium mustelinum]
MLQRVAVVKVMGVACNELGEAAMGMVVVASTLRMVVVAVEEVLYMVEVKVVVESEPEEVGNKQGAAAAEINMDKLEGSVEAVVENVVGVGVNDVAVEVTDVVVEGSYSSKELVAAGRTMEGVEVVNLVVEVGTSHNILAQGVGVKEVVVRAVEVMVVEEVESKQAVVVAEAKEEEARAVVGEVKKLVGEGEVESKRVVEVKEGEGEGEGERI